jgi:toxin FitB
MSGCLVDTDVISTSASAKREGSRSLVLWMDQNSQRLFISTVRWLRSADGIAKARREGARRKVTALTEWLDTLLHLYANRILPLTWPRRWLPARCLIAPGARVKAPDSLTWRLRPLRPPTV